MTKLQKSKEIYESAKGYTVRGVQTNFKYIQPHPIYFERAQGSRIWDVDGNEYIDCVMNFGPCILGHGHLKVLEAVRNQLETGLTVGLETELSLEVCKKLTGMIPSAESVRLSNTGTEAMMHTIQMARAFTGKSKIAKIEGGYNGWSDDMLISYHPPLDKAGPADLPNAVPDSSGLRADSTIVIPYNNADIARKIISRNHDQLAALIIEPIMMNLGCVLPREGYLQEIREITEENDVPLIFDEVKCGFKPAPGGAQEYYGVTPDVTVLAKAIANGFPLSAVVGKSEIINVTDPVDGKVLYGGTYNGNQMAVAAASATLDELRTGEVQAYLNKSTHNLIETFHRIAENEGISARMQGIGGNFQTYFTDEEVVDYRSTFSVEKEKYDIFQKVMFEEGIYFWPAHLFCHGISAAHVERDLEKLCDAMEAAMSEVKK
ncbi:aspartate aminotransferase family protein [Candidatus Thorarchaeota archaeon]|nr:MAG: aspartate aminotransferase family protein [Candidatus Thorarchaeota archaeon]